MRHPTSSWRRKTKPRAIQGSDGNCLPLSFWPQITLPVKSWLLSYLQSHFLLNVRVVPPLHNEYWKWVLEHHKVKPEIPPAGEMVGWQVWKLYNGVSSYFSYERYQNIKKQWAFLPGLFGIFLASSYRLSCTLGALGLESCVIALFPLGWICDTAILIETFG